MIFFSHLVKLAIAYHKRKNIPKKKRRIPIQTCQKRKPVVKFICAKMYKVVTSQKIEKIKRMRNAISLILFSLHFIIHAHDKCSVQNIVHNLF